MKIKNAKRIISILLAFMLTLVFAISIVHFVEKNKTENNSNVNVIALSGAGTESSPYLINNLTDLQSFASDINDGKNYYSDKYVKLNSDIDCKGNTIGIGKYHDGGIFGVSENRYFKGKVFDGGNFSIHNFKVNPNYYYYDYQVSFNTQKYRCYGLFSYLQSGTEIKNLRLRNFSMSPSVDNFSCNRYVGCLVGLAEQNTIKNCVVEDFTLDTSLTVCGVVGAGSVSMSNVLVQKVQGKCADFYGFGPFHYLPSSNNKSTFSSCVLGKNITGYNLTYSNIYDTYNPTNITGTLTNCKNTAGDVSGLSCSSEGGASQETTWYYGGSQYNSGYPYLRQFIKSWNEISFNAGTGGTVSKSSIKIPSDADQKIVTTGALIVKLEQEVQARPNTELGYQWQSWTKNSETSYTATFKMLTYTLKFGNATGTSGDTISPSSSNKYAVKHGTKITMSQKEEKNGSITLEYTFYVDGLKYAITYGIYKKYDIKSVGDTSDITGNRTITPSVELKKYTVKIYATTDVKREIDSWTVNYDDDITYTRSNNDLQWVFNHTQNSTNTKTYEAPANYAFNAVNIKKNGNATDSSVFTNISGNIEIDLGFIRTYQITFATIENARLNSSPNPATIRKGYSIIATYNGYPSSTITYKYSYNNSTIATYTLDKYYRCTNTDAISSVNENDTITPIIDFYACKITMGEISSSIGTRSVSGDTYTTNGSTTTDGIFVVELGTKVDFSIKTITPGVFEYIYKFNSGQVITYTITDNKYAMQYVLDNNTGERISLVNGLNGNFDTDWTIFNTATEDMSISPSFDLKQYWGTLG